MLIWEFYFLFSFLKDTSEWRLKKKKNKTWRKKWNSFAKLSSGLNWRSFSHIWGVNEHEANMSTLVHNRSHVM